MIHRVGTWIVPKTLLLGALLWACGGGAPACAQIFNKRIAVVRDASARGDADGMDNVFLPPDRTVLQQLSKAKELLEEERYGDAVRYLGAILDNPEDFFFQPEKNVPIHRSLKGEAQRLIGSMPAKGLELYQLRFGTQAKRLFDEAILDGDAERLAEVSRRFFHTHAGYEATFLLGLDHLQRARPLAAALTLQRLRETSREADRFEPTLSLSAATAFQLCGMREKARETLCALKDLQENRPVVLGGKATPFFTKKNDALDWLAGVVAAPRPAGEEESLRWAMFRGSASRNAAADGGAPLLNLRWQTPTSDDPLVEESLRAKRQQAMDEDRPVLPTLHPLVVDDVVLMRTVRNLTAIDFFTGKRKWEVSVDDPLESLAAKTSLEGLVRQQPQIFDVLFHRVSKDANYGTLSSDGRLVFSIEDLGYSNFGPSRGRVVIRGQTVQNQGQTACNRLAAFDIRTGKLRWNLGGPADQYALRLAETYFLGPPLPLLGQLYVLAESKGEGAIVLMALDAASGELLWSQPLAVVEQNIGEDPLRRFAGVSPSYADGVLVCPTSVGAVVAVELATRSLLWGYRYNRADSRSPAAMMRINSGMIAMSAWSEAAAVLADGKVLLTPPESDALHCLNLIDGKLLWSYTRQDDLYLACVESGRVILVGRRGVKALRLSDGKADWNGRVATFPEGVLPTGRGFLSKNQYFVPLSNAAVAAVDLSAGKIAHTAVSRKGSLPGNLVCYKGSVISQGVEGIEAFYQVDSVRKEVDARLAANPNDAGALALQGEILLDEGRRGEAVDRFRRAFAIDPDVRTRGLLRDALLDGLRSDFASSRAQAAEIEGLLDDDAQRALFLRLMAQGLQAAGESAAAFEQYLKLVELDPSGRSMEAVAANHSVRRDRFVRMLLAEVYQETKEPARRADLDRRIAVRRDEAMRAGDDEPLRSFLGYFGSLPAAAAAREELFRRSSAGGRTLEAEMLLWSDCQSADASVAGPATARLAGLMEKANRPRDAAECYRLLATRFAATVCRDGKTGKQLADSLPADSPLRGDAAADWPQGLVENGTLKPKGPRQPTYGRVPIVLDNSTGPFFTNSSVFYDQNQRAVLARDACGADLWNLRLTDRQQQNIFHRMMADGAVEGHLLLMSLGWKILAIDTASATANRGPKLLWDIDMTAPSGDAALRQLPGQIVFGGFAGAMPIAQQRAQFYRMNVRLSGVGPANHEIVCFQRYRTLTAVDPLTGETLWAAASVPMGSELFGDEQYVFALPPNEAEALVFRAADGQPLGKRKLPREATGNDQAHVNQFNQPGAAKYMPLSQSCLATFGRKVLLWRRDKQAMKLELFDPWEQKQAFAPLTFASNSLTALVGREAIAVCEPGGKFTLVSLPEGRTLIEAPLPIEEKLHGLLQINVEKYGDLTLVVAVAPPGRSGQRQRNIQPLPGLATLPIMRGWVVAFGPDGKPAWPKPAPIANQHLLPNQPSRSPLMVFACQEYVQLTNNTAKNQVLVQCIDKRTGRTVYKKEHKGSTAMFEVVAAEKEKKVELRMQQETVSLTLTDKPIPPEAEEGKKEKTSVAKAIFGSIGRLAERAIEGMPPGIATPADGGEDAADEPEEESKDIETPQMEEDPIPDAEEGAK